MLSRKNIKIVNDVFQKKFVKKSLGDTCVYLSFQLLSNNKIILQPLSCVVDEKFVIYWKAELRHNKSKNSAALWTYTEVFHLIPSPPHLF